jgi:hypothetical protein
MSAEVPGFHAKIPYHYALHYYHPDAQKHLFHYLQVLAHAMREMIPSTHQRVPSLQFHLT